LSWSAPSDVGGSAITEYRIYRGTSSGSGSFLAFVSATTTSYNDTAVTNNQTYYYAVSAVSSLGEGAKSNEVSATPMRGVTTPSSPQSLRAAAGDGYVDLSWSAPSDVGGSPVTEYKIYRGTSPGNEGPLAFVSATTTSYNDTAVTNNQTYYYTVSAVNAAGEGAKSEEASDKPTSAVAPSPPTPGVWKWLVPVLIIIAAIVIAIAAIFIYKKKKKGKKEREEGKQEKKISFDFGALNRFGAQLCPECGWELALIVIALLVIAILLILFVVLGLIAWWWLFIPLIIALILIVYILWKRRAPKEEKKRFCMHCGASMSRDVNFCPKCGKEPIKGGGDVKVCKNCNSAIPTEAKFCSECGASQPKE
jgi:RNA polymerase subunit RPABC4/transcription elongation factor Spt4